MFARARPATLFLHIVTKGAVVNDKLAMLARNESLGRSLDVTCVVLSPLALQATKTAV